MSDDQLRKTILGLFIAAIGITILAAGGRDIWSYSLAGILLSVNLAFIMLLNIRKEQAFALPPLGGLSLTFLVFLTVLAVMRGTFPVSWPFLLKLYVYFIAFLCAFYFFTSSRRTAHFLVLLVGIGTACAFYGLVVFLYEVYGAGIKGAALSGFYVNKNHFAGLMEMLIPCTAALFFFPFSKAQKLTLLYPLLMLIAGLGFSMSRGGWGGFFIALLLYICLALPLAARRGRFMTLGAIALIALLAVGTFFYIGITPITRKVESTVDARYLGLHHRFRMWESSFEAIRQHPGGLGPGTFQYTFQPYRPRGLYRRIHFAHSDYIQAAFETGIIGLIFIIVIIERMFTFLIGSSQFYLRRLKKREFDPEFPEERCLIRSGLLLSVIAAATAITVHSFVDFNLHLTANGIIFSLLIGIGMRITKDIPKSAQETASAVKTSDTPDTKPGDDEA